MTPNSSAKKAFIVNLMGRELTVVTNSESRTLQFTTKNADFMKLLKKYLYLKMEIDRQDVRVSADAMKEYSVSVVVFFVNNTLHQKFITYLIGTSLRFLFQNVDNLLSAVNCAGETEEKEVMQLIAKARTWNLFVSNN